jgi:hypothetical protein
MRFPRVFDDKETAILIALYEVENGRYTSYALAWKLNPTVRQGTPPAAVAFAETRDATERLIARGLVSGGSRLTGADGVYFNKLRLTPKGQRAAIQQRAAIEQRKNTKGLEDFLQGKEEIAAPRALAEFLGINAETEKHMDKK